MLCVVHASLVVAFHGLVRNPRNFAICGVGISAAGIQLR